MARGVISGYGSRQLLAGAGLILIPIPRTQSDDRSGSRLHRLHFPLDNSAGFGLWLILVYV